MTIKIRAQFKGTEYDFYVHDNQWWMKLLPGFAGMTLSARHVFIKRPIEQVSPVLIQHEAVHVYQARHMGSSFLSTYIKQWITAGYKYYQIPMEQEAYSEQWNVMVRW